MKFSSNTLSNYKVLVLEGKKKDHQNFAKVLLFSIISIQSFFSVLKNTK